LELALLAAIIFAAASGIDTVYTIRIVESSGIQAEKNPIVALVVYRAGYWGLYFFQLLLTLVYTLVCYMVRGNDYAVYVTLALAVFRLSTVAAMLR